MKISTYFKVILMLIISLQLRGQVIHLDSPLNGVTGQPIIPNFTWHGTDFNNDGEYILQISTSDAPNFEANVFFTDLAISPNTGSTSYNEATLNEGPGGGYKFPLNQNTIYYWRLTYTGSSSSGNPGPYYSPIYHFRTFATTTISLSNPGNNQTGVGINVNFSWSSSMNNASYKLQWVAKNTPPTPAEWVAAQSINTTNKQVTKYLGGGTKYYWRVLITNTSYNTIYAISDVYSFTTAGGAPTPIPSYPDGTIDNPTITYKNNPHFSWWVDGSTNYLKYYIEIWRCATQYGTYTHLTSISNISSTSYQLGFNLDPNYYYFWRVSCTYNDGYVTYQSDLSDPKYFKTNAAGTVTVPTLTYPINNNLVYTLNPYLQWCLTNGVTGLSFQLEYWPEGGISTFKTTTNYTYQLTNLQPGTKYYWRVRSYVGSTYSTWSPTETFTIVGGQLTTAVPNYPKDNVIVYNTKPNLSWVLDGNSLGITGYRIEVYTDAGSLVTTLDVSGGTTNNVNLTTNLTPGLTYKWRVCVKVGTTLYSWSNYAYFRVYGAQLAGVPILFWPVDATIYSSTQTFNWGINGSEANIQGYELVYSYSDVFAPGATTTIPATTIKNKYYTVSNLRSGAIYYWKVRSWYGGSVYSDYSLVASFLCYPGTSPMQPLVGGPNNMALNVQNPNLNWIIPIPSLSPLTYELEIADNPDFNNTTVIGQLTTNEYTLNNAQMNKEYYWRVRSKTPDGIYSPYSNTGQFLLTNTPTNIGEKTELPTTFELSQNYPNPFNPTTTINYQLPFASLITLKIYDVLGREIETLINENKTAGKYSIEWNASKYNSGVYYYELKSGDVRIVKKMMLVK